MNLRRTLSRPSIGAATALLVCAGLLALSTPAGAADIGTDINTTKTTEPGPNPTTTSTAPTTTGSTSSDTPPTTSAPTATTGSTTGSTTSTASTTPTTPGTPPSETCQPYPDVDASNIHCDNIAWLSEQDITKPIDGFYHPENPVTRGSMVAFLFRLTHPGAPSPECTEAPFPDVPTDHLFCGYIQWAADNGIAYGYPDDTYGPERSVTRGAMAAFLYRVVNPHVGAPQCVTSPFDDVDPTDLFCGVISWMKATHLTFGVGDGENYATTDDVTRQAMASFLHRISNYLAFQAQISCPAPDSTDPGASSDSDSDPGADPDTTQSASALTAASPYDLGPVQPKTARIANAIGPMFGIRTIYGWRDPGAEQYDPNGHPAGLALDFMIDNVPNGRQVGQQLAAYLQEHAAWLGVNYLIYRQHIWMAGTPVDDWELMDDRGSPTANHMDHVHLSLKAGSGALRACPAA